jgi:putative acetyltransferase
MIIKEGDFNNPLVMDLLNIHLSGMHENSPAESVYALDFSDLQKPNISFWTVWEQETLLGCGALKKISSTHCEIKSMRTHPDHLRKGVAAKTLEHILNFAKSHSFEKISLETGSGTSFDPAISLYQSYGFTNGDSFGEYQKSEFNQFFHLTIE